MPSCTGMSPRLCTWTRSIFLTPKRRKDSSICARAAAGAARRDIDLGRPENLAGEVEFAGERACDRLGGAVARRRVEYGRAATDHRGEHFAQRRDVLALGSIPERRRTAEADHRNALAA